MIRCYVRYTFQPKLWILLMRSGFNSRRLHHCFMIECNGLCITDLRLSPVSVAKVEVVLFCNPIKSFPK